MLGITCLMREGCTIKYYTDGFQWKFVYKMVDNKEALHVVYTKSKPTQIRDPVHHTFVEIENIKEANILFDNYLFLRPPSNILAPSDPSQRSELGYICLGEEQRRTLFVKGILVRQFKVSDRKTADLVLGYNLGNMQLTRDRGIAEDDDALCSHIYYLFETLLLDSNHEVRRQTAEHYLTLFQEQPKSFDIRDHHCWLQRDVADYLFKRFLVLRRANQPEHSRLWVYQEGKDLSNVINSLDYVPCAAPKDLYELWERHGIARTIFQERERQFELCKPSLGTNLSFYASHTAHLLSIFQQSHSSLQYLPLKWKDAEHLDVDNVWTSKGMLLNDRCLQPERVHARSIYKNCATWTVFNQLSEEEQKIIGMKACDCAAFWLAGSAARQAASNSTSAGDADSTDVFRQAALLLPRDFCTETLSVDVSGTATMKISWSLQSNGYSSFVVQITGGDMLPCEGKFDSTPRLIGTSLKHPCKST